jgi:hypothetical protein
VNSPGGVDSSRVRGKKLRVQCSLSSVFGFFLVFFLCFFIYFVCPCILPECLEAHLRFFNAISFITYKNKKVPELIFQLILYYGFT